ncbi:hypothetical protein PORY_002577 [Pneumocystis oryctolagi]|uniref:Uncharacterized protein n=1 Tax=Pneumocystis oryctolagi TaxID=42067 RepID=A0ACB7CGC8_9ASCO|nr:hypothetical protein PORY_002577 [Pneumocystis oryctolagi]
MLPFFRFSKSYKQYKKKLLRDNKYSEKSLNFKKAIDESKEWFKPSNSSSIYHKRGRSSILGFRKSKFSTKSCLHSSKNFDKNNKNFETTDISRTNTIASFGSELSENTYFSSHTAKIDGFKIFKSKPRICLKDKVITTNNVFPIDTGSKRDSRNSCISSLADEMNNTEIRILLERDQRRRKRNKVIEKNPPKEYEKEHSLSIDSALDKKLLNFMSSNRLSDGIKDYNFKSKQKDFVELPSKHNNDSILKDINDSWASHSIKMDHSSVSTDILLNNSQNDLQKTEHTVLFSEKNDINLEAKEMLNNQQKDLSFIVDNDLLSYLQDQNSQKNSLDFKYPKLFLSNHFIQNNSENKNGFIFRSSIPSFSQSHILQEQTSVLQSHENSQLSEKTSLDKNLVHTINIDPKVDNVDNYSLPTVFDPPFSTILSPSKLDYSKLQLSTLKNGSFSSNNPELSKNVYSFVTDNFLELFEFFHDFNLRSLVCF